MTGSAARPLERARIMKASTLIGGIAAIGLIVGGGWFYASPGWTLSAMRDAANAKDFAALSAHVDYPALREDMKSEFAAAMAAQGSKDGGALGGVGAAIGMAIANKMIDGLISPEGIRIMFAAAGAAGGKPPASLGGKGDDFTIERSGLSEFKVVQKGDGDKPQMVFRRDGLSWKLSGIDLPRGGMI
jgi:Protein of unknown function (DUF2939)